MSFILACGVNFPIYAYNYVNGIANTYPKEYALGKKWRNLYSDLIYTSQSLLKKKTTFTTVRIQNRGKIISALWDKKDKKPFFTYGKLLMNFIKNR